MDEILRTRLQRANKEVSLLDLVQHRYGIRGKYSRDGVQINCPFHGDSHPSSHVYESSNRFWCFACKELYDVVRFVARREGVSLQRAVGLLELWYKLPPLNERAILTRPPDLKVPHQELSPRELLKAIFRLLGAVSTCLTLEQYERAFVAWWVLAQQQEPSRESCVTLLSRLQFLRDDAQLVSGAV